MSAMHEIRMHVTATQSDTEEIAELTSRLRDELLVELGVDCVTRPSTPTPENAKGDALAWAELVVALSGSLPVLIGAVRSWRGRQREATITVECAGDRLILSDATPEQQDALVDAWLARHEHR
jgi:hypothetical protein